MKTLAFFLGIGEGRCGWFDVGRLRGDHHPSPIAAVGGPGMTGGTVELMADRRLTLDKIVRSRDGRHCCERCFEKMRYRPVTGMMREWSPAPYAWFCPNCGNVLLDGSIKPEDDTWSNKMKTDEKRRLSRFLYAAMQKKNSPGE